MDQKHIELGKSLAHLRLADEFADNTNFIYKFEDKEELSEFRNRLIDLTTSPDRNLIIHKLDHSECTFEAPVLKDNSDLFLLLLFQKEIPELCSNLGKHLNDCYQCFQIFSQVMQDYYQEYQNLYSST
jgi:hypothetical protein